MSDDQPQTETPAQEPGTPKPAGESEQDNQSIQGSVQGSIQGSGRGPESIQGSQLEGGKYIYYCLIIFFIGRQKVDL